MFVDLCFAAFPLGRPGRVLQARFLASIESLKSLCPENNGKAMMVGKLRHVFLKQQQRQPQQQQQEKKRDETKK